jgi:hypothetical protein
MGRKAQPATVQGHGREMHVTYPDARVEPRVCVRTNMRRETCPCAPCRALRRKKHGASCQCWLCYADRMGAFIDNLGRRTRAGRWLWFVTPTYRTKHFPWAKGFPIEQPEPSPDFVHNFFAGMIQWIEREVHARVEYFTADQFGEVGGRLHQHCGLSWPGLFEYRWKDLQEKLWKEAGFNRILPWEEDAGYYIGRYIGRDAQRSYWNFRVGHEPDRPRAEVGRRVMVHSKFPDGQTRKLFDECRPTIRGWHR